MAAVKQEQTEQALATTMGDHDRPSSYRLSPDATKRERTAYILWQNQALLNWAIDDCFGQLPPLVYRLLTMAARALGVDLDGGAGAALIVHAIHGMPDRDFDAVWDACATMFGWVVQSVEHEPEVVDMPGENVIVLEERC